MPSMIIHLPKNRFSRAEKDTLAEELTQITLQIEGGADTPEGRSIAWVRFDEVDSDDWYIGGSNGADFVSASGKFLIELNVPEGSMNQERKSRCHSAITDAIVRATGQTDIDGASRSIWVQIFEWPEGHLATSGRTSSLLGIAQIAGLPKDHPLLEFPRAYFMAKDRLYNQAEFPEDTAGRALVWY